MPRSERTRVTAQLDEAGRVGVRFERRYDHDVEEVWWGLTGDVDPVPDESVVEAEAPYLLVCTTGQDVVTWKLRADGAAAVVELTLSVDDPERLPLMAANCHAALEQISDSLDGEAPATSFDDLVARYARAFPSAA